MRTVPFHLQGKGFLDVGVEAEILGLKAGKRKREGICRSIEPTSVLETKSIPSPPTSTSTRSASLGGGSSVSTDTAGVAAVSGNALNKWTPTAQEGSSSSDAGRRDEWASELQPIPMGSGTGEGCSGAGGGVGMDDLESILSSPGNEQSIFRWFVGDIDDASLKPWLDSSGLAELEGGVNGFGVVDSGDFGIGGVSSVEDVNVTGINPPFAAGSSSSGSDFTLSIDNMSNMIPDPSNLLSIPLSLSHGVFHHKMESIDEKLFNPQALPNIDLLPSFPYTQLDNKQLLLPPDPKRHHPTRIFEPGCEFPKTPFEDFDQEMIFRQQRISNEHLLPHHLQMKPKVVVGAGDNANHNQLQAFLDQLFNAAELVEMGNYPIAQGILARLNHQLLSGKPLQRAAFYLKEAMQLLLNSSAPPHCNPAAAAAYSTSPLDVVFKMSAYKVFSEISPFLQFVNFTSNQAILEAIEGFDQIHIVDFDIGIGGQWASFMQEYGTRRGGVNSLKITAFVSLSSHHPLELNITKENLTNFANDLNILFELNIINLDTIDVSTAMSAVLNHSNNEVVAVNFPVGSSNPLTPLLLRLVKNLSPKIVVSIDHGCERSDLSFSQYIFNGLQSYSVLFDSLDAANVNSDAVHKIEKFLVKPKIESAVLGRHTAGEKMPPWRSLFASMGFSPLVLSNFTEMQAEHMVNNHEVRGFHVEKCQASLYLYWQHGELVSVSAWRC